MSVAEDFGIGHNQAPDDIVALREQLAANAKALVARRDELLASCDRAPLEIASDEVAGKMADLIKLVAACHKTAETARTTRKEPFLAAGRAVDGFFKTITEPLESAKRALEQRLTAFQRRKAEEERRRREAEERASREEAGRLQREAANRARTMQTDSDLDAALTADALAQQATAGARQAAEAAAAKPAELSRARGDLGSVASLRSEWTFADLDRTAIDLDVLRPYLPLEAIERGLRAYIRAGGRAIRGARIFEDAKTVVR